MHVSRNRDSRTCGKSGNKRKTLLDFLPLWLSLHAIHRHLVNQGKRHGKGKSSHKSTHQVIGKLHLRMGKLGKKNGKVLAAIIIINMPF